MRLTARTRSPATRTLVAFIITVLLSVSGLLRGIELSAIDALFALNVHTESSDLTLVEIDSYSLRELHSWPWPRSYHARLIDTLIAAGAKKIAFDIDFSSNSSPAEDRALAAALQRSHDGQVILPAFSQSANSSGGPAAPLIWTEPLPAFRAHSTLATVNVLPDSDGTLRRIPSRSGAAFSDVPSLNEVLSDRHLNLPEHYLVDFSIDVDSFTRLSFADVLAGKFPRHAVQGRKVLIGATAVELGDHFSTPLHRSLPGVYLQALAYQSTHNTALWQLTPPLVYTTLLLLLGAYCTCVKRQKWQIQLLISLVAAAAILLLARQLFTELRLILPVATLLSAIALAQAITWLDNLDRQTLDLIRQRLLLRNRTAVMRAIVHNSMDAILAIDAGGVISDANPAAAALFGYTPHGLLGCAVEAVLPHWHRVSAGKNGQYGTRAKTEARQFDGTRLPVELSIGYARLGDGSSQFVFLHDITQQLEYERELEYRAGHDSLTGLLNRRSMEKCLADATRLACSNNTRAAFLLVDLDHFKEINDTLGHPTGDRVLLKIAARMSEHCRETGVVARIGGDEFGILLERDADINRIAGELVGVIRKPLTLDTMTIEVSASIGISVFPDDAADETTLVQHADVAMYLAKELACGYRFYDAAADRHSLRRLAIIARLREAIQEKQLYIVYQPKIALTDRRLVGAEALIRWRHPELGAIAPAEFIPIAEQIGMIDNITLWLIDEVLGYIRVHGPDFDRLSIAVNISAKSLVDPQFPDAILSRLHKAGVAPARLALEVTETAVIGDPEAALGVLNRLNAAGIVIEIDDFGTGYSSLSYLSRFPARRLKIDRSFVVDMLTSATNHTIVAASIELAHRLGMQTVAEGIEDDETLGALAALGCDYAQGYVISKPLPADVFANATATKATWSTGTPVTRVARPPVPGIKNHTAREGSHPGANHAYRSTGLTGGDISEEK